MRIFKRIYKDEYNDRFVIEHKDWKPQNPIKKYLVSLIRKTIKEDVPKYAVCRECGLVFANKDFLKLHQTATGHKNPSIVDMILQGTDEIFNRAANKTRKSYYKGIGVKEEPKTE